MVTNLARTLGELKERNIWCIGTSDDAPKTVYQVDLKGPVALVLGAEGAGMRQLTRRHCDELVRIPMAGAVESLNVSVAAGVCLYEALRHASLHGLRHFIECRPIMLPSVSFTRAHWPYSRSKFRLEPAVTSTRPCHNATSQVNQRAAATPGGHSFHLDQRAAGAHGGHVAGEGQHLHAVGFARG
jgi:hypothetical protein